MKLWWCLFIIIPWFAAAAPPDNKHLNAKQMIELDRFEWRTVSFAASPPAPRQIRRFQKAVEGRTTIEMYPFQQWITYDARQLRKYPFLHVEMCSPPPSMSLKEKLYWRDFFNTGGTLYLDYCNTSNDLIKQWEQWGRSIYPDTRWEPMNTSHVLSHSFYLLEKRMLLFRGGASIYLLENDDRYIIVLNRSNQWSWKTLVSSNVSAFMNAPAQEIRLRFYINVLMYLLTGNYKKDQLHLPTILLRRK